MHKKRQSIMNSCLQDLNPLLAGISEASSNNTKSLQSYNYALIHYVLQGHGTFFVNNQEYPVQTGQAFLLMPGQSARFEASLDDPWALRWIGFGGNLSHSFSAFPPVFDVPEEVWNTFCDLTDPDFPRNILSYLLSSELFLLYAKMLGPTDNKRDYVQRVIDYVQQHYMKKITVEEIAAKLGLTRSYLTDLFRKKMGKTIRAYIIEIRIMAAKQYMINGSSVKQAALQSGFNDVSYFIKRFTQETEYTPTAWKQKIQAETKKYLET